MSHLERIQMKVSDFVALCGAVSCGIFLGTPARASDFSNADTKHRSLHITSTHIYIDYDKFAWLAIQDAQPEVKVDHIVVSLADQRLYAYRHQRLLAWSNVSSGRPGRETPTGSYIVSEKDVDHHSSLYDDAAMPFFMRLTDDGLGLHAGFLPGYPASHGCVRMPLDMARELYQRVDSGTRVDITGEPVPMKLSAAPIASLSQL